MTSNPINSGICSRDCSTAIFCIRLIAAGSEIQSTEPASPFRTNSSSLGAPGAKVPPAWLSCPIFSSSVICLSNASARCSVVGGAAGAGDCARDTGAVAPKKMKARRENKSNRIPLHLAGSCMWVLPGRVRWITPATARHANTFVVEGDIMNLRQGCLSPTVIHPNVIRDRIPGVVNAYEQQQKRRSRHCKQRLTQVGQSRECRCRQSGDLAAVRETAIPRNQAD